MNCKINKLLIRRKDAKVSLFGGECVFILILDRTYRIPSLCLRRNVTQKKKHPLKKVNAFKR